MATIQFDLDAEEEARFSMLLREMQLSGHLPDWTAGRLAKSLVMSIVDEDIAAHNEGKVAPLH